MRNSFTDNMASKINTIFKEAKVSHQDFIKGLVQQSSGEVFNATDNSFNAIIENTHLSFWFTDNQWFCKS